MMKPGTQTGSLVNHLYSRMTKDAPEPEVGTGATLLGYSDRHAATVQIVLLAGEQVAVTRDTARVVRGSGQDGSAEYEFTPNPQSEVTWFRKDDNGAWRQQRRSETTGRFRNVKDGYGLILGRRDHYRDPSF